MLSISDVEPRCSRQARTMPHRRSTRRKLFPLMFPLYLADLTNFLGNKYTGLDHLNNIREELLNDESINFFYLYLLMYADDTVLLANLTRFCKPH